MAYASWQTKQEPITKVNVTPIIDVALVLVIILLVTAPMLSVADLPVNLPQAQTREAEDERNVSVTLAEDGALAVDNERVAPEALTEALTRHLAQPGNHDALVVIRADSKVPYGHLRQVLDQARAAGAARLAIATSKRRGPDDRPRPAVVRPGSRARRPYGPRTRRAMILSVVFTRCCSRGS